MYNNIPRKQRGFLVNMNIDRGKVHYTRAEMTSGIDGRGVFGLEEEPGDPPIPDIYSCNFYNIPVTGSGVQRYLVVHPTDDLPSDPSGRLSAYQEVIYKHTGTLLVHAPTSVCVIRVYVERRYDFLQPPPDVVNRRLIEGLLLDHGLRRI